MHMHIEMNVELQKQVERVGIEAATIRQLHEADMEVAARLRSEADTRQARCTAYEAELGSVQLLLLAAQQGLADRVQALADVHTLQAVTAAELDTLRGTAGALRWWEMSVHLAYLWVRRHSLLLVAQPMLGTVACILRDSRCCKRLWLPSLKENEEARTVCWTGVDVKQ